jgi:halogenation protein CepH
MSHPLEENSSIASEIRENNYVNAGNAEQFDVVVVGGGPSGSTMAAVTALRGRRTLVLESDLFPG